MTTKQYWQHLAKYKKQCREADKQRLLDNAYYDSLLAWSDGYRSELAALDD